MSLILSVGKPVGIIAAVLGLVQGLTWFILTLLAVLSYNCAIDSSPLANNGSSSDAFLISLLSMYFIGADCVNQIDAPVPLIPNLLQADEMQIWMIMSMVFNFAWMVASIYYLVDLCRNAKPAVSTSVWIGTASVVVIMDLASTIRFGINYGAVKAFIDKDVPTVASTNALTAAAFLMAMAARGFVLWMINDALVIFLTFVLSKGHKASKAGASNLSRQASFVNPTMNHMWPDDDDKTYQHPRDSRADAWDPPTPVAASPRPLYPYSTSPTSPQGYSTQPRQQQPVLILQDPPKTHSLPYGATPRHIPDPDYSPILNHKNMIPPVVLRKPPPRIAHVGRTVF